MLTGEYKRLCEKYKNKNLREELEWASNHAQPGYLNKQDAQFVRWLCAAALEEIKAHDNN